MSKRLLPVIFLFFIFPALCWAHKVNLFCYREKEAVHGEAYYSGGKAAQESKVDVYDGRDNTLLKSVFTDKQGQFSFVSEESIPLQIVLYAGQGHKTTFVLDAEENGAVRNFDIPAVSSQVPCSDVEAFVEHKIQPLKARIARLEKEASEPSFTDVAGGIVLIAVIFYLLYLWRKKHAS